MKRRHLRKKKGDSGVEETAAGFQERRIGALSFDVEEVPQTTKKRSLKRIPSKPVEEKAEETKTDEAGEKLGRVKTEKEITEIKVSGSFKPVVTRSQSPEAFHRVTISHPSRAMTHPRQKDDDTFMPPDTHIIEMAKEKRVRLRQAQLAPDYLPLGGTSQLLRQAFPEKEDPSSGSDAEEDHMRLKFVGHLSSIPKVDEEMDLDVMEDEDAVDSFVDAQIKKGISAIGRSEVKTEKKTSDVEEDVVALPMITHGHLREKVGRSRERLENACSKYRERRTMTQASLQHARNILEQSEKDIHRLKDAAEKTEQQYLEVQELRAYVGDLCMCLKEKLHVVEEMEDHVHQSEEELKILDTERRLDELDRRLIEAASNAIVDALSKEESQQKASNDGATAVEQIKNEITQSSPEDLHLVKERWEVAKNVASEGYSSNLPVFGMECLELGDDIKEIEEEVSQIFSDALPEFASVSAVIARFHGLKTRHPKLYRMAYIADSLSELLATFVRLDILTWRPLRGTPLGLEHQSWYRALEHFGDQEEEHLVPELVKRVALPTAVKHIEACWSPYDKERTSIVAEMLKEMLVYVPMEEEVMQKLLKSIQQRLKESVALAGVSSVTGSVLKSSEVVQMITEVQYQKMLQLIGSLLCFDGLLPTDTLQDVLVGQLLIDKCLPYLMAITESDDVLQKTMKVISMIPESMLSTCSNASRQVLGFLRRLRRKLEKQQTEDVMELEKLSLLIERLESDT